MNRLTYKGERVPLDYGKLKVRLATRDDATQVKNLRVNAYGQAINIRLIDPEVMAWNTSDDENLVFVVENEHGELISTMKALLICEPTRFLEETNIYPPLGMEFPVLYLKTGSTARPYWGNGLNALLKMEIVRYLSVSPVRNMINTINQGTSRIQMLEGLGFNFEVANLRPRNRENSPFKFNTPLTIGTLHYSSYEYFLVKAPLALRNALGTWQRNFDDLLRIDSYLSLSFQEAV